MDTSFIKSLTPKSFCENIILKIAIPRRLSLIGNPKMKREKPKKNKRKIGTKNGLQLMTFEERLRKHRR